MIRTPVQIRRCSRHYQHYLACKNTIKVVSKSKNEAISAIQFIILVKMLLDSFATVVNSTPCVAELRAGRLWPGVAKTAVLLLSTVPGKKPTQAFATLLRHISV